MIGFDSMGTRGMATVLDTGSLRIFLDPGVNIAPRRYSLPPHPLELEALEKHLEEIRREVKESDVVVISHYHRDHYLYRADEATLYRNKILLVKDPVKNINYNQKVRAYVLFKKMGVESLVKELYVADGGFFRFNGVEIRFSKPVPHGSPGSKLGFVLVTAVRTPDIVVVHASDTQGPMDDDALNYIINSDPDLVVISGPPTYFEGKGIDREDIEYGLKNLKTLAENLRSGSTLVVDHHLLRDLNYKGRIADVNETCRARKVNLMTAAEYMGLEVKQLEALRFKLWEENQL